MKNFLALAVISIFSGAIILFALFYFPNYFIPEPALSPNVPAGTLGFSDKAAKEKTQITFFAAGDIMLDRGVEYKIEKIGNGDFKFPFLKIADELKKADIIFGNLESVISDKGRNVGSVNSFRADPKAVEGLVYAGFDIVSVCNNHALDYTGEALEDSLKRLKTAGIKHVGAGFSEKEAFSSKILEVKNTKFGFLAYSNLGSKYWRAEGENSGIATVSDNDLKEIKKEVSEAKKEVDILVVSFHWGDEYSASPNGFQELWGRAIIDAGADLVLGHHPHVGQPLEKYNNGWIAYSLGNFVFDQWFSKETMQGFLLEMKIENKKIKEARLRQVIINNDFQPYFSEEPADINKVD